MAGKRNAAWNVLRMVAGVTLIIFGIAGLFLPFLQGILMIGAGVALLGGGSLKKVIRKLRR